MPNVKAILNICQQRKCHSFTGHRRSGCENSLLAHTQWGNGVLTLSELKLIKYLLSLLENAREELLNLSRGDVIIKGKFDFDTRQFSCP